MSKTNDSDLSGLLGESIKVRKVQGKVVIKNRPKRIMGKPVGKQEQVQARFLEASQYATKQIGEKASNAMYEKGITDKKKSAYVVAMSDYLKAPKVHFIQALDYQGAIGDTITAKATDDFMVIGVKVIILGSDGTQLEQGEAGPDLEKINLWTYKATVANPSVAGSTIKVIAFRPAGKFGGAE